MPFLSKILKSPKMYLEYVFLILWEIEAWHLSDLLHKVTPAYSFEIT